MSEHPFHMKRHVIILAQGQERVPDMLRPRQMIGLPLCGGMAIMGRTIMMARELDRDARITVVSELELYAPMFRWAPAKLDGEWPAPSSYEKLIALRGDVDLETTELPDPGTSALKGISRYLDHRRDVENLGALEFTPSQTVVLLGDCVYSWRCMNVLFSDALPYNFVGTSELTDARGDIWGITWRKDADDVLQGWMKKALRKHPATDTYHASQLRQWLFVARAELDPQPALYTAVDDYTRDFDVPSDLDHLYAVSGRAAMDDIAHGLHWGDDRLS